MADPYDPTSPLNTDKAKFAAAEFRALKLAFQTAVYGTVSGPVTATGMTMNSQKILGRLTAGVGAIEELPLPSGNAFIEMT